MNIIDIIHEQEVHDAFLLGEEFTDMANYKQLTIGTTVRILPHTGVDDERVYDGKVGKIIDINPLADDGDAFGVSFPDEGQTLDTINHEHIVYFWASELEVIS